jgi:recombination protein RecT
MLAGELGLEPASPLGHFYMIPRNIKGTTQCTHMIGYKGMCELARRSGFVKRINADIVYQDEIEQGLFSCSVEPPEIRHKWSPVIDRDQKNIVCAYAIAELSDGNMVQVVLTSQDIDHRRSRSSARGNGPWVTDYAAMARKSALRALLGGGLVPLSAEMSRALQADDEEIPSTQTVIDISSESEDIAPEPKTGTDKLRVALGVTEQPQPVVLDVAPDLEPEEVAPAPKKKRAPRKKKPTAAAQSDVRTEAAPQSPTSEEQYRAFELRYDYHKVVQWCVDRQGVHPDTMTPDERSSAFYALTTQDGREDFEDFANIGNSRDHGSLPF